MQSASPEPGTQQEPYTTQFSFSFLSHFQLKTDPNQLKCPANCQILPPTRWFLSTVKWLQHPCKPRVFMEEMKLSFSCPVLSFTTLCTSSCHIAVDPCQTCRKAAQCLSSCVSSCLTPLSPHPQANPRSELQEQSGAWVGGWMEGR